MGLAFLPQDRTCQYKPISIFVEEDQTMMPTKPVFLSSNKMFLFHTYMAKNNMSIIVQRGRGFLEIMKNIGQILTKHENILMDSRIHQKGVEQITEKAIAIEKLVWACLEGCISF